MTNISYAPNKARAHLKNREQTEIQLLQTRIQNVGSKFVEALHELPHEKLLELLTLQDETFWAELKNQAQLQTLINTMTPENRPRKILLKREKYFLSRWRIQAECINQRPL